MTIYQNNKVEISINPIDAWESEVNVNGDNLIVISASDAEMFEYELNELLEKYRI